jgi:DNA replication factor Cdt1 C-terminal domain
MATRTRSHLPRAQSAQSIQRFTRASKPGALPSSGSSKALLLEASSPSKKRKLNEITNDATATAASSAQKQEKSVEDTPSKTLKFSHLSVSTPRSSRTGKRTPTKTSVKKFSAKLADHDIRPSSFIDFANLHSSFLKALALHSAHNNASPAADLRELLPSIEKIWKKRKVVVRDVQRMVHVWNTAADGTKEQGMFRIANYGLGRVCLERPDNAVGLLDETRLQERFISLLDQIWKEQSKDVFDVEKLDLAPIHDSLTPLTTFRKGQQRLQDLRGGVIKAKTAALKAAEKHPAATESVARDPVADRRKGLFERIKNKELLQSKLGPAPTKEQLLRRSAAQRAEDVAQILAMLRPPHTMSRSGYVAQKKPFICQSLIQTVQDSLRNPIPAEEIAACLDILAQKNVAGEWVEIVTVGSFKSVVLMSVHDVSPRDIGARVAKMEF